MRSVMRTRYALLPILLSLALVSCSGSGKTTGVQCVQQFWNGTVGVCLPKGWGVVERESLQARGVPDQVMVAFQSEKTVSGQTPTITVTHEKLPSPLSSPDYSKASIRSVAALPGYKLLDGRSTDVEGQTVQLHIFTAQPVAGEPERRFFQVSAVAASIGYTVTALTPVAISDTLEKEVLLILGSLRFTEPVEESS